MNKGKIAELYKQAHREHRQEYFSSVVDPTVKSVSVTRYFDHELFAELIVQECIKLGQTGYSNDSALTIKHYSNKIKEHFGVNDE
jgi:hypothetical protein